MRLPIVVPDLGEMIEWVRIRRWLKEVGQPVAHDEDLLEISTDKIDAALNAPSAGVLAAIDHAAGERVRVGTVVGFIEKP